ncbi:MFS transporter [Streptomyces sp. NBC_00258]|uniref:MFS transporter n=1 Tax=Streptomyces sp. NBC_00258 TaxID=2903642 RepID=UPI002E299C9D|nr:MFS transporter [Streptomyces sp. NBC_00258]
MTAQAATPAALVPALPRAVRWGYGGGEWANAVVWTSFTALFLYFFTDIVHASAALGGTLMLLGTLCNTLLQPYIGLRSDRLQSRHGRRLPFLALAAVPYAVTSWLLFTDPGWSGIAQTLYFGAVVIAWSACLTFFYVPYGALGAELSTHAPERTALATVRTACSQMGALVGAVAPLLLAGWFGGGRTGWSTAAAVTALLAAAGILITWATARGRETAAEPATTRMRDQFAMLRSPTVRRLLGALMFGWAPISVTGAVNLYYALHIMQLSQSMASALLLVWFMAGLAWLPLVQYLSSRIGKTRTYVAFTTGWFFTQCLFLLLHPGDQVLLWTLILLSSAGSMAVAVTTWSLLADVSDIEELRTGERREGALYGLAAFAQTALAALAVWFVGLTLSAAGYHGGEHPNHTAREAIRLLMSIGTAVWLIPGILCCLRLGLTHQRHHAVRAALDSRAADTPILPAAKADLLANL